MNKGKNTPRLLSPLPNIEAVYAIQKENAAARKNAAGLLTFNFENKQVRTALIDGAEWWVARDVARALGFQNESDAIQKHCKGVAKRYPLATAGGVQEVRIISEGDVWRLITRSNLPEAERFEKFLFEVILPQIRKTGGYNNEAAAAENKKLRKLVRRYETRRILTLDDKQEILTMYFRKYPMARMCYITKKSELRISRFLIEFLQNEKFQEETLDAIGAKEKADLVNRAFESGVFDGFMERHCEKGGAAWTS